MNHLKTILAMIAEIYHSIENDLPLRPGPRPTISDLIVIELIILKHLLGFRHESSFLRFIQNLKLKSFFPQLPERTRFNRRSKALSPIIERIQFELLKRLEADDLKVRIIDTTPLPIVKLARRNQSKIVRKNDLKVGYCSSQKYYYIGLKLSLSVNLEGVPTHFDFHPANNHDLKTLIRDADKLKGLILVGDKGYVSQPAKENLKTIYRITVITPKRKNQKDQRQTDKDKKLLKNRKLIERTINQLKDQFNLEKLSAKSLNGFKERVRQIILTYTFGIYFNKRTNRNILSIKSILT